MKTIENNVNVINKLPDFNSQLSTEDRIKIFANLIIDRVLSDIEKGVIYDREGVVCTNKKTQLPL